MLHISKVPISIPGVNIRSPRRFYFSDNTSGNYFRFKQATNATHPSASSHPFQSIVRNFAT